MVTDWSSLVGYYIVVFLLSLLFGWFGKLGAFLAANLLFLGFIVWVERPYIPIIRKNHYVGILVSTLLITFGLIALESL